MKMSGIRTMLGGLGLAVLAMYQQMIGRDTLFWIISISLIIGYALTLLKDEDK